MEFTEGMITVIAGASAFAVLFIGLPVYLIITKRKMKKILKRNETEEE